MDQLCPSTRFREPEAIRASSKPRAIIVSDVVLYREGLAAGLLRDGRLAVLELVGTADVAPAIARNAPDVILLDGAIDDYLDLARKIRASSPGARIVGFGITGGADQLVECAEHGLANFVGSTASLDELLEAVLAALRDEAAFSPHISALICKRLATLASTTKRSLALTRREREIAVLIGQGLSNKEIAIDLRIGPSTVKNHVHNILEKLNVRRRSAIVQQLNQGC